jgi:hypothetical protein
MSLSLSRAFFSGVLLLLAASGLRADLFVTSHFGVNLNDCTPGTISESGVDCSTTTEDPNGSGGWESGQVLTFLENQDTSTSGFSQNTFSCDTDGGCNGDPTIIITHFPKSGPFPGFVQANDNGGGFNDYFNDGPPITEFLIRTQINTSDSYVCSSDIFGFCGFRADPLDPSTLEILFTSGTITTVPEPSAGMLFLTAAGAAMIGRKIRSRRA